MKNPGIGHRSWKPENKIIQISNLKLIQRPYFLNYNAKNPDKSETVIGIGLGLVVFFK